MKLSCNTPTDTAPVSLETYPLNTKLPFNLQLIAIVDDEQIVKTKMSEDYSRDTIYPLCIKKNTKPSSMEMVSALKMEGLLSPH